MGHLLTNVPARKQNELVMDLAREVTKRVQRSNSIEAQSPQEIVVRDVLPQQDFNGGGENGATVDGTGDEEWKQDWATGSATADSWNEAYEIDSRGQADEKVLGFIGIQFGSGDPDVRELRFLKGTAGTQGVKGWFNVEAMENDHEGTGIFADSVIYGPTENGSIEMWLENTRDEQRERLIGVVGEAVGETITDPHNPMLAQGGGR